MWSFACQALVGLRANVLLLRALDVFRNLKLFVMPSFSISENHRLTTAEASARIARMLGELKTRHADKISDVREDWNGPEAEFSFKLLGFKLEGRIVVTEREVHLLGKLPLAALPFKGLAERAIRDEARELLDA